ncbi:glycoside hydrolase family 2 protein [Humibacter sp.]|jgi:beta-galactosidase|uniref:glycoside hydrolase family 2 protein n=1 Tax=Humibacter sp. TaxID=1940291 RepID=UPI002BD08A4B|nr:glycoside hydrolase family 2 TIM barrel-domain containing protein [Humibacter sp.]HVX06727.1 glycoside hydrolase family 2 TIM barrel-domain containing protein [Humibacter sp.]
MSDTTTTYLRAGWRFTGPVKRPGAPDHLEPEVVGAHNAVDLDDSGWEQVTLPHTVAELGWQNWDPSRWEEVWAYRLHFATPDDAAGNRVFVHFEGAMTTAVVSVNGTVLGEHRGGYLPFSFEITDLLVDGDNVLAVLLDSRGFQNVPPNLPPPAPSSWIDYWQPGGIHRDVRLEVVPPTFISAVATTHLDPIDPERRRSEFVVSLDSAVEATDAALTVELLDAAGEPVSTARVDGVRIEAGVSTVTVPLGDLQAVELWDIDNPVLYTVRTSLTLGGDAVHSHTLRTGYRETRWDHHGFFLNGTRRYLFGVNRHGLYPWSGFTMSERTQRKDAEIIKQDLNCNFVRCSHYPQDPAFLDACDELGLLVWEESPGWQYVGDQEWQDIAADDIAGMIARDRHRPSIVIWGARLNETPDHPDFWARTEALVKELDPTRATSGTMHGDYSRSATFQHDVFSYDDYTTAVDEDGDRYPVLLPPTEEWPYLLAEAISSRSSPTTMYRRVETADVQQHQALDYAIAHNDARADDRYLGIIAWVGFDYQAGFGTVYHGLKTSGFGDVFRILKPGAAFYRSQVAPSERVVVEPAFTWDPPEHILVKALGNRPEDLIWGPGRKAIICSNVDRLEVFLGGRSLGTVTPDRERFPHLEYPPSFIDLDLTGSDSWDLRIDGYLGDELVATRRYAGDRVGDSIELSPDDSVLVADGRDATRVVVAVVDRFGERRGHSRAVIPIDVDGPGELVGDPVLELEQAGAVAAVWIRTIPGRTGSVVVKAATGDLGTTTATIRVVAAEG